MAALKGDGDEKNSRNAVAVTCRKIGHAFKALIVPSVGTFHVWAGLIYLTNAVGFLSIWSIQEVHHEFCQLTIQAAECDRCSDRLLLCEKPDCLQSSINITWQEEAKTSQDKLYQDFQDAVLDEPCNNIADIVDTPAQMIQYIQFAETQDPVSTGCKAFHCTSLQNAFYGMSDLYHKTGECTNTWDTKRSEHASVCHCSDLLSQMLPQEETAINTVCGTSLLQESCGNRATYPSFCPSTTSTTTVANTTMTTTNASASARRLGAVGEEEQDEEVPATGVELLTGPGEVYRPKDHHSAAKSAAAKKDLAPSTSLGGFGFGSLGRLLTSTSSADAPTAWTVGEWSPCTCYQQCMPGVQTRRVSCGAPSCRGDAPAHQRPCTCFHCARCQAVGAMTGLMFMNFGQAFLSFLLFVNYQLYAGLHEDQLIKINFFKKIGGFVCKNVPYIVYIAELGLFGANAYLIFITFGPELLQLDVMQDCYQNRLLRLSCIVPMALWVLRLLCGRCAIRYTRVPPQLYAPRRSMPPPLKQIDAFIRSLGPV